MMTQATLLRSAGLLLAALGIAACGASDQGSAAPDASELSAEEKQGLAFLREEEKLARDVYAALDASDPSFANIKESEQRHFDAVGVLLTRYLLPDPAAGKAQGEFTDPALQRLHDQLVARGLESRLAALTVGVEIEELDLRDLQLAQDQVTHEDVAITYDNLARGSRNHLRTYHGKLVASGGSYTPQFLDATTFFAIAESDKERGQGN
ncbi:MAG: DUF2202 domain-containing protein [Myxococcales bacterium]|nr:DUF2202 domain-containing protein [Myxococcales bacterium]